MILLAAYTVTTFVLTIPCSYVGKLQLRDLDYIKLQFLGARNAWLGCPSSVCDLRTCPSRGSNYLRFNGPCFGEEFQIIGEGTKLKKTN